MTISWVALPVDASPEAAFVGHAGATGGAAVVVGTGWLVVVVELGVVVGGSDVVGGSVVVVRFRVASAECGAGVVAQAVRAPAQTRATDATVNRRFVVIGLAVVLP